MASQIIASCNSSRTGTVSFGRGRAAACVDRRLGMRRVVSGNVEGLANGRREHAMMAVDCMLDRADSSPAEDHAVTISVLWGVSAAMLLLGLVLWLKERRRS